MAQIARENGINDSMLFNWQHQKVMYYRQVKKLSIRETAAAGIVLPWFVAFR